MFICKLTSKCNQFQQHAVKHFDDMTRAFSGTSVVSSISSSNSPPTTQNLNEKICEVVNVKNLFPNPIIIVKNCVQI